MDNTDAPDGFPEEETILVKNKDGSVEAVPRADFIAQQQREKQNTHAVTHYDHRPFWIGGGGVFAPVSGRNTQSAKTSSGWLIIFTDIIALMITFFVLMYSMSTPVPDKWTEIRAALNKDVGTEIQGAPFEDGAQDTISLRKVDVASGEDLEYLENIIRQQLQNTDIIDDVEIALRGDELILLFDQNLFFDANNADISEQGAQILDVFVPILSALQNRVQIVSTMSDSSEAQITRALEQAHNLYLLMNKKGAKRFFAIRTQSASVQSPAGQISLIIRSDSGGFRRL